MKEHSLLHLLFLLSLISPIFSLFRSSYPIPNTGYSTDDDTVINVFPDPVNPGEYGTPPPHWPERTEQLPSIGRLPIPLPSDEGSVGSSDGYGAPLPPWDAEGSEGTGSSNDTINPTGLDGGHSEFPDVDSIPVLGPEFNIPDDSGSTGEVGYETPLAPLEAGDSDGPGSLGYGSGGFGVPQPPSPPLAGYPFEEEPIGTGGNYDGIESGVPEDGSVGSGVDIDYGTDANPSSEVDLVPRNPIGNIGYGAPPPQWEGEDLSSGAGENQSPRGYGSGGYGAVPAPSEPWDGDVFGGTVGGGQETGPEYGGFEVEQPVDLPGDLEVPEPMETHPGDGGYGPGLGFGGSEVGSEQTANPLGQEDGYELPMPAPASDNDPILIQVFPDTVPSRGYGVPPLPQGTEEADGDGSFGGYGNGGYGTEPLESDGDGSGQTLPGDNEEPAPAPSPIRWPFVFPREEEKIPQTNVEDTDPVNPVGIDETEKEGDDEDGSVFPELCDPHGNWDCILYRR